MIVRSVRMQGERSVNQAARGQVLILSLTCVCECYLWVSCPTLSVSWAAVMTLNQDWSVSTPLALPPSSPAHTDCLSLSLLSVITTSSQHSGPSSIKKYWTDSLYIYMFVMRFIRLHSTMQTLIHGSDTIVVVSVMHQWVCDIEVNNVNREQFQQHASIDQWDTVQPVTQYLEFILYSFTENKQWGG